MIWGKLLIIFTENWDLAKSCNFLNSCPSSNTIFYCALLILLRSHHLLLMLAYPEVPEGEYIGCHISINICQNLVYFRFLVPCGLRWRRRSAAVTPRLDQLTNMHRVTMLLGSHHLVPRQLKLLLLEGERFLETLAPEKSFRSGPLRYTAQTKRCSTKELALRIAVFWSFLSKIVQKL